jgi:type VI secretion system protein ImpL
VSWAKNRWVLGAAGLAAFALVIWLVGDTIALGDWRPFEGALGQACAVAIAAGAWLALEYRRARAARRRNEELFSVLAGAEGDSAVRAAHEIALLRQRFEEAAAVLRKARFKGPDGEPRYVQELPWYVIIGAPGSGKTTALVNSGLRFPLPKAGSDPSLAGIGGTRNCDWWFTEEAVLLDTAGRYTTQESDLQADAAAWSGFLDLLKRFRPKQPLNGALVTVSISDLMLWSEEERARYARHVRARVEELYQRLGVRFPIYLLVTKADLLAGFAEFFGELDAEGRARVWGTTFDIAAEATDGGKPAIRFAGEFVALEHRLYAELGERLQQEPDLQRRAAIYRFPQEFHGTGSPISDFLDAAFGGSRDQAPLLRGVYFTSGTQEGSPIDRVLGSLARSFKLERAASAVQEGTGKSFFLTRLLREVIFPESGLAGSDESLERSQRRRRGLAFAAIAVLTIAAIALWSVSFVGNLDWIATAEAKTKAARSELQALDAEAQPLKAMRALGELPGARESGRPWLLGMGLYQGDKVGAQAQRAYRNGLRDILLPRVSASLEDLLRNAKGREAIAGALDAYQALYDDKKPDMEPVAAAMAPLWRLESAERAELAAHLRAGIEAWGAEMRPARNDAIIRDARQRLAQARTS